MYKLFCKLIVSMLAVLFISSSFAINRGDLDGDAHAAFIQIVMEVDGYPAYRCSGVLLAPTYMLTAGQYAGASGESSGMRIFTESDVDNGASNYPFAGPNSIEVIRWAAHPDYPTQPFYVNDVGVIEPAEPISLTMDQYASLPVVNILDSLKTGRGLQNTRFTTVGYGLLKN